MNHHHESLDQEGEEPKAQGSNDVDRAHQATIVGNR